MDSAVCNDTARVLQRLGPVLDRFVDDDQATPSPAYVHGTVPSEGLALPEQGIGIDAALDELEIAIDHGCRIGTPGFLGYITTTGTTISVATQAAVAAAGGQRYLLHSFNALEWTALRWLAQLCRLPADAAGVFTSGGSSANLVALGAARQAAYERRGIDIAETGMPEGAPRGRVYASARAHRTVHRAAAVLGLGREGVREVPCDLAGHLDVEALRQMMRSDADDGLVPVAVVAIAGTTDSGAIDPLRDVIAVAREHACWVHVDGAYGLVANAVPELADRFAGVEEADSWIVDPHKWLATGLGVGAVYVRDGDLLTRAFAEGEAAYLEGSFSPDPSTATSQFDAMGGPWADQSVELSAPPRGVLVWAALLEIGAEGVRDRVRRHVGFARALRDAIVAHDELELLCEPDLSIVCFRFRAGRSEVGLDQLNATILQRLRQETPFVPSSTVVGGSFALRPCFINPRTTIDEVHGLVEAVVRIGRELAV